MVDRLGREINYLRLSVTNRCQLHCAYCRAERENTMSEELSLKEINQIGRVSSALGIKKIRLTGGEPLVRDDISEIAEYLSEIPGIEEVTLTTNGILLPKYAEKLKKAGVNRVNISLDSLNAEEYKKLTGGNLSAVLRGIEKAKNAGMNPVKINAVLIKGENDGEIEDFLKFAEEYDTQVRFIELMPLGRLSEREELRVTMDEILPRFGESKQEQGKNSPARYFRLENNVRAGVIAPMSSPFCDSCNRIRILSDGSLRPCLGRGEEYSLKPFLGGDDEELRRFMGKIIYNKPQVHGMNEGGCLKRDMSMIGG